MYLEVFLDYFDDGCLIVCYLSLLKIIDRVVVLFKLVIEWENLFF